MAVDWPMIAIVTPSFNQANFIGGAVDSVLGQCYPRIDYIVVDGASTDGTVEVLRSFGDRLRWVSEPDNGQSAAINKGWRLTTGDIIAWLNSDDTLLPGALQHVARFMAQNPNVDVVYGDCDYVDSRSQIIRPYLTKPFGLVHLLLSPHNFVPQPATFIRRTVLEDVGYLDEDLHYVMDLDFWLRIAVKHRIEYLPERLAALRLHKQAKSVGSSGRFPPEMIRTYTRLFDEPGLQPSVRSARRRAMSMAHYRAAHYCFASGQFAEARRYAIAGWRLEPRNVRTVLLKVLVLGSMGRIGLWAAERLAPDPLTVK